MAEGNIKITKSYTNAEKESEGERERGVNARVHTYRHTHILWFSS